jgi:hypothetical protein
MDVKLDPITRLRALRERREAAHGAATAALDRVAEIRDKLRAAREDRARYEREYTRDSARERLDSLDVRIEALNEELAIASDAQARASAAFQNAAEVHQRAADYARERALPMPETEARGLFVGGQA